MLSFIYKILGIKKARNVKGEFVCDNISLFDQFCNKWVVRIEKNGQLWASVRGKSIVNAGLNKRNNEKYFNLQSSVSDNSYFSITKIKDEHDFLTVSQGFNSMRLFLTRYYFKCHIYDLGALLGDFQLFKDKENWKVNIHTWDPAAIYDWKNAIKKTINKDVDILNEEYSIFDIYQSMINHLEQYGNNIKSKEVIYLLNDLRYTDKNKLLGSDVWTEWLFCSNTIINNKIKLDRGLLYYGTPLSKKQVFLSMKIFLIKNYITIVELKPLIDLLDVSLTENNEVTLDNMIIPIHDLFKQVLEQKNFSYGGYLTMRGAFILMELLLKKYRIITGLETIDFILEQLACDDSYLPMCKKTEANWAYSVNAVLNNDIEWYMDYDFEYSDEPDFRSIEK